MGGSRPARRDRAHNTSRPNTRGSRPKLTDPITNTNNLNARLKSLGLYAANTIGDGNCLFRALSDQLYGSPAKHLELRQEICDFIEARKDQYAGFIEDDRGIDTHLGNMRVPGTYGGHVELAVFARLKKRDVKVIQPDVCYVIEHKQLVADDDDAEPSTSSGSPKRRKAESQIPFLMTEGTIYVAYHDWEHFSSVRNIKGPHHGLPNIHETPEAEQEQENIRPTRPVKATISKHKLKAMRGKVPVASLINSPASIQASKSSSSPTRTTAATSATTKPTDPFDSRDSSPLTALSQDSSSSAAASIHDDGTASSAPSSLAPVTPPDGLETARRSGLDMRLRSRLGVGHESDNTRRSPKRSFGESDLDDGDGSTDGRRVRRRGGSGMSNLSSASPPSIAPLPPGSPDEVGAGAGGATVDDDEDKSVIKLLDDDAESDSSLSPPPPNPRARAVERLRRDSSTLDIGSQDSTGTAPPSSVSPSSRPSPAPESQTDDLQSQSQTQTQSQSQTQTKKQLRQRPLTRREKKALGLPKHGNASERSNVIVIPGGRHPSRLAMRADQERQKLLVVGGGASGGVDGEEGKEDEEIEQEWERNGSGRKDSRGFVILNI